MNELLLRRRVAASTGLPYDSEVEYLEQSSIDQYIDTGIVDNGGYTFKGDFSVVYYNAELNYTFLYGYYNGWGTNSRSARTQSDGQGLEYRHLYVWYNSEKILVFGNEHIVIEDAPTYFKVNGTVFITRKRQYISNNLPVFVFRTTRSGGTYFGHIKCRYFQILNGNIILIDLVPVVKDGVGYMYDKVSGKLFGNAGTGSFILGPDK